MKTFMPRTDPYEPFTSSSRGNFQWALMKIPEEGEGERNQEEDEEEKAPLAFSIESSSCPAAVPAVKKPSSSVAAGAPAMLRIRSVLIAALAGLRNRPVGLGSRVKGTLFGRRRGHVHLAFQVDARPCPAPRQPVVLIELAMPTSALVREMSSGLVRLAFECERKAPATGGGAMPERLVGEPRWRAYCNGKKCGYAARRECGPSDLKVLRAVEPVSMGAGVIPADKEGSDGIGGSSEGDVMYMRARFERVVGSRDSEAFYMMNPDGNGGPELSVYFLRV